MKKYIAPEALIVSYNAESRFALAVSEYETGAGGMESNSRVENMDWEEEF